MKWTNFGLLKFFLDMKFFGIGLAFLNYIGHSEMFNLNEIFLLYICLGTLPFDCLTSRKILQKYIEDINFESSNICWNNIFYRDIFLKIWLSWHKAKRKLFLQQTSFNRNTAKVSIILVPLHEKLKLSLNTRQGGKNTKFGENATTLKIL